ncbi:MAG: hypothetical protein WD044_09485 [Dongiaceae bacterium]
MPSLPLLLLAGALLAACTFSGPNHVYPTYADADAQNSAVMVIDPNPPGAQNTDIPMDGKRAVGAYVRYETDTVEPPVALRTTSSVSGGGV